MPYARGANLDVALTLLTDGAGSRPQGGQVLIGPASGRLQATASSPGQGDHEQGRTPRRPVGFRSVKPTGERQAPKRRIGSRRHLYVDVGSALDVVGSITKYLALTPLLPASVALGYGESPWPFLITAAVVLGVGLALERVPGRKEQVGMREGYLIVALTWVVVAAVGALPYLLSGDPQLNRPLDAYFEAMSGFTTTGATILTDIDQLPRGLLMWRQLTQWFGGMGISFSRLRSCLGFEWEDGN